MKIPFPARKLIVLGLMLFTSAGSYGALKPCGFITDGKESRFVFEDTESGRRYTWVAPGQRFWDFTVVGFDSRQETLFIKQGQDIVSIGRNVDPTEFTSQPAAKPVVVVIGGYEAISVVAEDTAMLGALKQRLVDAAAQAPQPVVTIRVSRDSEISSIRNVAKVVRSSGLQRINFAMGKFDEKIGIILK